MKNIITLFLIVSIITVFFSACSEKASPGANQHNTVTTGVPADLQPQDTTNQSQENTTAEVSPGTEMVDPYDGTTLAVDTSWNGTVQENAEPVGSNTVIINSVSYEFPFAAAQLFENSWVLSSNVSIPESFASGARTDLVGVSLYYEDRDYLSLRHVYNNGDIPKPLNDCLVTGLNISIGYRLTMEKTFSFVLPGGITWDSSAADVIAAFGPAQNNANFDTVRVLEKQLTYMDSKDSGLQYIFSFNEDGTIYSITIELEG